jgi:hypothetical protein
MARTAAIPPDEILDRPFGELSAAELLSALSHQRVPASVSALLPDKKKYELWVDEGVIDKVPLSEILRKLRLEKKKVELEKLRIEVDRKLTIEEVIDPTDILRDPAFIEQVAEQVAAKLGR